MRVPFVALGRQNGVIAGELLRAMESILYRSDFILGSEVTRFEEAFAERIGCRFAVGVNSGLDALLLTLKALGLSQGDEVITVPNSYVATAAAIALAGATPVFVDVDEDENINVDLIEQRVTANTKAILPVHLRGRPAKMASIVDVAGRHNLHIIEDAAQAIDATYAGRKVGTFGIAGCFSLHPLKNLGACGDGGIVTTNDESLYRELLQLRNHGLRNRDFSLNPCESWGHNSRLDTMAAAVLNVKLRYLDGWTARRRAIVKRYLDDLRHLPIALPREAPEERCVYHAFVIQTPQRDALKRFLEDCGVETKVQYPSPTHLQPAAARLDYRKGDFPVAEDQCNRVLSVPVYPELTDVEVDHIIASIGSYFGQ